MHAGISGVFGLIVARLASSPAYGQTPASSNERARVAIVAGEAITATQLRDHIGNRLFGLKSQEYWITRRSLDELIAERVPAQEATARGTTRDQLVREEIEQKIAPVTDEEVRAVVDAAKGRLGPSCPG